MSKGKLIPISEFARLSGISRPNLIFYDNIGILRPEAVGKNKYRYYGYQQFEAAYLLLTLKEFGMPQGEIRDLVGERTPEGVYAVFNEQKKRMTRQMEALKHRLGMIQVYLDTLNQTMEDRKTGGIIVKELPTESLVLGPVVEDFRHEDADQYFVDFSMTWRQRGLSSDFPSAAWSPKRILSTGNGKKSGACTSGRRRTNIKNGRASTS
jgi:Predicted transcriptional regulators